MSVQQAWPPTCSRTFVRRFTLLLVFCCAGFCGDRETRDYTAVPGIRRANAVLWRDPGAIERLDLRFGAGGRALQPRPPFTFIKEDSSGSTPKVRVRDAAGRQWVAKFGEEARSDTFGSRMAWALGYFTEINYFVPRGVIGGARGLKRAKQSIDERGRFTAARFQLRATSPEYLAGVSWSWEQNPFVGTPQLNGLKVLMMLLSNWDDKDIRDAHRRGTNTAIYKNNGRYLFFVDDWGGSMGHWGKVLARSKWDCVDYYRESAEFIRGVKDGEIEWGYRGTHTDRMTDEIRPADLRWLLRYLGRLTDTQLHAGLRASGATPDEAYFYTKALRMRITQLQDIARGRLVARAK
jgi:hypothetical protein